MHHLNNNKLSDFSNFTMSAHSDKNNVEENEMLLNIAQKISRSGSFYIDLKVKNIRWSENNYRIFGYEPYSIVPTRELFDSLVYPEDFSKVNSILEEFKKTDHPLICEYEFRLMMPDGSLKWFQTYVESIFIDGKFEGIRGTNIDIHEKKMAELEYTSQNQKFNAILNATPDLIFIYNKKGICLDFFSVSNDKKTLIPKEKIIGSNISDIFNNELASAQLKDIKKAIKTGKLVTREYSSTIGENNYFFEARMTKLNSESALIFIRDITVQKRAEIQSKDILKRQNLQAVISHEINISKDISKDVHKVLKIVSDYYNNSCIYLVFDESISELSTCAFSISCNPELICEDEFLYNREFLKDLIKDNSRDVIEYTDLIGIKSLITAPLFSEDVKIGVLGLVNNSEKLNISTEDHHLFKLISDSVSRAFERFLILKKLENSTLLLNHFIEIAKEGHWDIDLESRLIKYNETGSKMLGYKFEEISIQPINFWKQLIHPDDFPELRELFSKCIEGKTNTYESITRIKCFDGSWKWIMIRGNVVRRNDEHKALRIMGIHVDITNQKNTEELLKSTLKNRDKLFSIIAHDLRGPIHNIIPMLEMYSDNKSKNRKGQSELFSDIKKSVQNTADLLDNLLSWARIQSKTQNFTRSAFLLGDVVSEIINLYSSMAELKSIKINVLIPPELTVDDDINSAKLVLRNLINNALKYTLQGGTITIQANYERENVLIKISDNGLGMSEEMVNNFYDSKLFESTYGTRNEKGTGLGLALCKESIENNGGTIDIYSKTGVGTRFEFTLRRGSFNKSKLSPKISEKNDGMLLNKKILLVEDDSFSQLYGKNILSRWGTIVDIAENGKVALKKLEKSNYDVILMDIEMPVLDGFSTIKVLKYDLHIKTPIIVLSSNISEDMKEEALLLGCRDYIIKPGNSAEIYLKIIRALDLSAEEINIDDNSHKTNLLENLCDWNKLVDALGNDNEAICQIILKFLEVTPAYFDELLASYERKDFENLRSISHKFKSSISLIANSSLIENIQEINNLAKNPENLTPLDSNIEYIKIWFPKLCQELRDGLTNFSY